MTLQCAPIRYIAELFLDQGRLRVSYLLALLGLLGLLVVRTTRDCFERSRDAGVDLTLDRALLYFFDWCTLLSILE